MAKWQDVLEVSSEKHPNDFLLLLKIKNLFKIKNLKLKGDTMLIDLTNVKASTGPSTVLPEGEYTAYIDTAELKTTKDGQGTYIKTMWKIATGEFTNRTIFQNYNIKSASPKAQEIGLADLKKVLEVNGRTNFQVKTVSELVGLRALVYVKVRSQVGFADTNTIASYKSTKTATTTTTTATTQRSSPSPVPGL